MGRYCTAPPDGLTPQDIDHWHRFVADHPRVPLIYANVVRSIVQARVEHDRHRLEWVRQLSGNVEQGTEPDPAAAAVSYRLMEHSRSLIDAGYEQLRRWL